MNTACRMHGKEVKCTQGFGEKPETKRRLGKPRREWEDNVTMDKTFIGRSAVSVFSSNITFRDALYLLHRLQCLKHCKLLSLGSIPAIKYITCTVQPVFTISDYFILSGTSIVLLSYIEVCELNPFHDSTPLPRISSRENLTGNVIMWG